MQTYFTEIYNDISTINPGVYLIFVVMMLFIWSVLKVEDCGKEIEKTEKEIQDDFTEVL